MANTDRVDKNMFNDTGHYLGKPADIGDKLIHRRINLVKSVEGFLDKEKDFLEIGCGNGATTILLSEHFNKCLGVDINDDHKDEFISLKEEYNATNCSFRILNVEQESLNKQYDRIISFEVIEHLNDDKRVDKFYELLKPGGIAIFSVPNKWWIFETHGANLPLLPWNRVPFFSWLPKAIHEKYANARIYTKKRILNLLNNAGFEILDVKYITAPLDVLKDGMIKKAFTKSIFRNDTTKIPFLSTSIFITVKRPDKP